ncbi:hypothetical protein JL722_13556 [Aureococcus anophagefferens]|nr:hypothetical protein JL722_13556 [Aureococcus anophagefferens]
MREALLEINKGGNFGGVGGPFIGDVGMGMLDGRGVSPEQAAAIFRVYDTAQSGQLTYEQFANVFRLMSAPERTDELRLLSARCAPLLLRLAAPMVCFWPHGIIFFGSPCAMAAKLCWAPRANAATTVRLTPNAVVSVTEPYAGWSACMGPPIVAPCNCCLVCMGGDPMCTAYKNDRQVVDVVPLEFVDAVDVLRPVYPGGLERLVTPISGFSSWIVPSGCCVVEAGPGVALAGTGRRMPEGVKPGEVIQVSV